MLLDHPVSFTLSWCRLLEKKVDHLAKMTDELTKRQLEREDTALQYKRYLLWRHDNVLLNLTLCPPCVGCRLTEQKLDQLTEMTAELTIRLQGREGRVPFRGTH